MYYKHICKLPEPALKSLNESFEELNVYLVTDFNVAIMKKIEEFEQKLFGKLSMDRWGIVPQIRHGNIFLLKESENSKIIGLAIFMRDFNNINKCYLFDYAITPTLQGKNLGYHFLKLLALYYKENDFNLMELTCDVDNTNAIKLYKDKLKFKIIEKELDEYGIGEDRYVLSLDLNNFK
ncbi:MAG: GNAT family N-acetyltransferase [Bacillota bacterium]|nr:GNAT family N-acetyltransferase [Bacillota bacterium]